MKKKFKAESQRLLDMMINSIYTHKEIFLREIISNASDAIDKMCYLALTDKSIGLSRNDFEIILTLDKENRTLTVSDNGIGMNEEDLEKNLGTIAFSGSKKFAEQLDELTAAIFGDRSFILFGTSMGGSITTTYAAQHPEKVEKLVLLAPAGMDSFEPPFYMKLANIPLLGELIFKVAGVKLSMNGCAKELIHSDEETHDNFVRQFAYTTQYKGMGRCLLSCLRHTILNTEHDTENYRKFAEHHIPTLVMWGTEDATMPYYQMARMQEVLPEATFVTLEGSGHIFLYDEGDLTMQSVLPFLND